MKFVFINGLSIVRNNYRMDVCSKELHRSLSSDCNLISSIRGTHK